MKEKEREREGRGRGGEGIGGEGRGGETDAVERIDACAVDLPLVNHFDLHLDLARRARVAPDLSLLLVKLFGVDLSLGLGQQNVCNHEVVELCARRVRAEDEFVPHDVAVLFRLGLGQPLHRQTGPF